MEIHFTEQFKRTERWHQQLKSIYERPPNDTGVYEALDNVYAFFQNCYHLKDWLKNDSFLKIPSSTIEDFVSQSQYLQICADVCHGSKHSRITTPRLDANTNVYPEEWINENHDVLMRKFTVDSAGQKYDALDLAKNCVADWHIFLKAQGVSFN